MALAAFVSFDSSKLKIPLIRSAASSAIAVRLDVMRSSLSGSES